MTYAATLPLGEAEARHLADILGEDERFGPPSVAAIEIAPGKWEVTAYFEDAPDLAALDAAASDILARPVGGKKAGKKGGGFTLADLPETDWVTRSLEGLAPVVVGRFNVHGRHDRARVRPNQVGIEIEAGLAFGTGHHGTTAGCLAALERLAKRGVFRRAGYGHTRFGKPVVNVLDLGTGSGVLAIAIAKAWHIPVIATDIDPVAVEITSANAEINATSAYIASFTAKGFAHGSVISHAPYDVIVANVLAGPLVALAPEMAMNLAPGGHLVLSGLLPDQQRWVVGAYGANGFRLERADRRDGWLTLTLRRP